MRRRSRALLTVAVVGVGFLAPADAALARDAIVRSFDGTPLNVHFFPADDLEDDERAPVVMLAHGFGESAPDSRDDTLVGAPKVDLLLREGYNVLTWDARGHGGSGGTAMFDSPDFEVRDTRILIDWAADQPEVELDRRGDPRLAMTGASYGGIIQFLTAGVDRRVDVITPAYTGHSLPDTMIAPQGKFKESWGLFLAGASLSTIPPGVVSPAGPQLHSLDPEAASGFQQAIATGQLSDRFRAYLEYRSPSRFIRRLRIPTLLQQGTTDTLFPLVNAIRNFKVLRRKRVPVKMVWNCEGHSLCGRDAGPAGHFDETAIRWFDRWLKRKRSVRTGRPFEWLADNEGEYRSARRYRPRPRGRLTGIGSGGLRVSAGSAASGGGAPFTGGAPSSDAVNVTVAPCREVDVLGHPRLKMSYSGTASTRDTWLYAQIVDLAENRVVGGQVTPIPVTLDGAQRSVKQKLEAIATRAERSSRYRLQVLGGSLIFGQQRSTGTVELHRVEISLPIVGRRADREECPQTQDGQSGSNTGASGLPGLPSLPDLPGLPELPDVPGLPDLPLPGLPGVPSVPGLPGVPSVPGAQSNDGEGSQEEADEDDTEGDGDTGEEDLPVDDATDPVSEVLDELGR